MKKIIAVLLAAVMAVSMMGITAMAEGAAEETPAKAPIVVLTDDGVLSIELPADNDNWKIIQDPNSWFAISDGLDLIAVDHIANGEELPKTELANDKYEEIFQVFYSTQNEVFVVTGRIAKAEDTEAVRNSISSFKVLKYDTIEAKKAAEPVYAVTALSETRYCTEADGVNVRAGYTTDDEILGGYSYGMPVSVTGMVTKDGADFGWLQVDYEGKTGYVWGEFFSKDQPAPVQTADDNKADDGELIADGQIFTGNTMELYDPQGGSAGDSHSIIVHELSQGGWADQETGVIYYPMASGTEYQGSDGSILVTYEYFTSEHNDDELIAGGQIFTGNTMELYDPQGGSAGDSHSITVYELNQGGWTDQETGVIYYPMASGTEYQGTDGSIMVTYDYFH